MTKKRNIFTYYDINRLVTTLFWGLRFVGVIDIFRLLLAPLAG